MKLTFLGTRGNIEARTSRHYRHASLMVGYYRTSVMIDCGRDWLDRIDALRPGAILVTHFHPDHAFGLVNGAPCPVYATKETWEKMTDFPIRDRNVIELRRPLEIGGIHFETFPVEHSTRAPAVGYRVTAGRAAVFYIPDVVYIRDREEALKGIDIYIGDGATLEKSMVRKINERLIGHAPVRTQLTWCGREDVTEAVITHCGSGIVNGDERSLKAKLGKMGDDRGVNVTIAHDGMERVLR